jgi:molecular chaperone GrpE
MSGEPSEVDPKTAPEASSTDAAGDIPVEVEAPAAVGTANGELGDAAAAESAPVDRTAELEAKIAGLEKEKKDNWDRYLRAAADLENLRKRQKREAEDAKFEAKAKVLKEMLPVVDNLERAVEHAAAGSEEKNPIVEGVQLVLRQFTTAFERLDVTAIDAMGQPFDPNLHEAISQQESDQPPGTVVQVLQRGYKSGDRLLRPSLVVVAKAKAAPPPPPAEPAVEG